jgi:hypothetical protein
MERPPRPAGPKLIPALALALAACAALPVGCQRPTPTVPAWKAPRDRPEPPWFADVTDKVGLKFVHDPGPLGSYFMPQIMGSGAALFDLAEDGGIKYVYLLHNGGPSGKKNQLFRRQPGGRFKDVSRGSGLDVAGYGMGVAVGDVNNDGLPDVLVTQYGGIKLFLNQGDGTFADVTEQAGLKNAGWGTSAAFFDFDRDGRLDLVVANYVAYDPAVKCPGADGKPDYCGPNKFKGQIARLFRNLGPVPGARGKSVRFKDVTAKAGLAAKPGPGLGVVCADFDGDGWPDILVANDGQPNHLWINRRDGTFKEEAAARGLAVNRLGQAEAGMGIALGDVAGRGLFDVFITHLAEETNTLWGQKEEARGLYQDSTTLCGLTRTRWRGTGFGTVLADFNQDGAPDLAVVNGRIMRTHHKVEDKRLGPHWSKFGERNQLFVNTGTGRFRDVSRDNKAFCGTANVARGLACGDVDGDGALDLLVTTVGGRARLYRNVAPARGHWLLVRAVDPALGGRDAYGAEVRVTAGGRTRLGLINPAGSYLSSGDPRAHFGLAETRHVDGIEVRWPDGTAETFPGCPADRRLTLHRGAGKARQ